MFNKNPIKMHADPDNSGSAGDGSSTTNNPDNEDWRSGLPEDLRASPAIKDIPDVVTLTKSFLDTQSMVGNSIRIPTENASEEDRKVFLDKIIEKVPDLILRPDVTKGEEKESLYAMLGRPNEPTGYKIPEVEGVESVDVEMAKAFGEIAHAHGLNQDQYSGILSAIVKNTAQAAEISANEIKQSREQLRQDWGLAYDKNMALVESVVASTKAPQELVDAVKSGELGPDTSKWLLSVAQSLGSEPNSIGSEADQDSSVITPAEAKAQISEIMNNKKHPYWVTSDPYHQDAVKKMVELHRMANPGAARRQVPESARY
jgi:copper chaperone CopZ